MVHYGIGMHLRTHLLIQELQQVKKNFAYYIWKFCKTDSHQLGKGNKCTPQPHLSVFCFSFLVSSKVQYHNIAVGHYCYVSSLFWMQTVGIFLWVRGVNYNWHWIYYRFTLFSCWILCFCWSVGMVCDLFPFLALLSHTKPFSTGNEKWKYHYSVE